MAYDDTEIQNTIAKHEKKLDKSKEKIADLLKQLKEQKRKTKVINTDMSIVKTLLDNIPEPCNHVCPTPRI